MPHVSMTDLVDLARGVLEESRRPAVEAHLRTCRACDETRRAWVTLAQFVADDERYEPPASVVDVVKSCLPVRRSQPAAAATPRLLPALIATLVFDSWATQAVGIRSAGASGARHLLFEAPPFAIDVQMQDAAGGTLLTGQISGATRARGESPAAQVLLVRDDTEVARLECNEFGEFHGEYDQVEGLSLVVAGRDRSIVIPLSTRKS